jgi:hypothetical protein
VSYALDLLKSRKEEYVTILDITNKQLEKGREILRSNYEIEAAKKAKTHHERLLSEIDDAIEKLESAEAKKVYIVTHIPVWADHAHGKSVHDKGFLTMAAAEKYIEEEKEKERKQAGGTDMFIGDYDVEEIEIAEE